MRTLLVAVLVLLIPLGYGDQETKPDEFHGLSYCKNCMAYGPLSYEDMGGGLIGDPVIWDLIPDPTQDNLAIFKRFKKEAEQGDTEAMYKIGTMYYYGMGVSKDYEESIKWYKRAVAGECIYAQVAHQCIHAQDILKARCKEGILSACDEHK